MGEKIFSSTSVHHSLLDHMCDQHYFSTLLRVSKKEVEKGK